MSKSAGNVIDPNILADKYGAEAIRYYLMSDIAIGRDADFSEQRLIVALQHGLGELAGESLKSLAEHGTEIS